MTLDDAIRELEKVREKVGGKVELAVGRREAVAGFCLAETRSGTTYVRIFEWDEYFRSRLDNFLDGYEGDEKRVLHLAVHEYGWEGPDEAFPYRGRVEWFDERDYADVTLEDADGVELARYRYDYGPRRGSGAFKDAEGYTRIARAEGIPF
jgi:hypothetical protein